MTKHLSADEIAKLTTLFLDQVAECFDDGKAVGHSTPFRGDPAHQWTTAGELLEKIRLGK